MNEEVNKISGVWEELNRRNTFGIKDGCLENYHDSGNLRWRGNYKNNKRTGYWESYYDNGKLYWKGYYVASNQIDHWIWRTPEDKMKQETIYIR